jgi:hypothetical protein
MSDQQVLTLRYMCCRCEKVSAASSVHLKMWILAKCLNTDKPPDSQSVPFKRLALFCTSIAAAFPAGADQGSHLVVRGTGAKCLA